MTRSIRHRRACALAAAAFALLVTTACGDGAGSPYGGSTSASTPSPLPTESSTAEAAPALGTATNAGDGEFLVDQNGLSLYLYTPDARGDSTCYHGCAQTWPPFLTDTADVTAGDAVDASLIGTTKRTDGTTQVTYNKWPLYYYSGDQAAGDVSGQGLQSIWFLVTPGGDAVG
jgi:predicted lipoprotein with Yx(FWY)xxD motif